MCEFLGGDSGEGPTARYVAFENGLSYDPAFEPRPAAELAPTLTRKTPEVFRSLWDREDLVVDLDIEYVNFDRPTAAFTDPQRAFSLQAPVLRATRQLLGAHGIAAVSMQTGRGFHFLWSVSRRSRAFRQLAALGRQVVTPAMRAAYRGYRDPAGARVTATMASAFAGLGLVMEYVGHRLQAVAELSAQVPIQLTDVEIGVTPASEAHGREIISVDVSAYGDLLHQRTVRLPFSIYRKHLRYASASEEAELATLYAIPLPAGEIDPAAARDAKAVVELARASNMLIPRLCAPMERLVAEYVASPLAEFHRWFHSVPPREQGWPDAYDLADDELPRCARRILDCPNDLLLKPAGIQHVVRVLMAGGWHPRHVAGLIGSKYAGGDTWRGYWERHNASSRSDFYTRLFAGLIAVGRDRLIDFNCRSHQERGFCGNQLCALDLREHRARLAARVRPPERTRGADGATSNSAVNPAIAGAESRLA